MTATVFDRLTALADPIRSRLLLALEDQELTVTELRTALQLPQSTVSRHLKVLGEEGWVTSRANGTSNWYRMAARDLDPGSRRLWVVVREQLVESAAARRDRERVKTVLGARRGTSREFFATDAAQWERVRNELFGPGLEWLALGGLLDPEWTIADLGAGTGHFAAAVAPLVARVIAVDESAAMLDAARARARHLDNVDCRQGALEALPLDAGSVDLAATVLVLHHLVEPARAVSEASRVLVRGGRLIVVDMMPHERAEYRETMGHQWLGFDETTVGAWFAAAGLESFGYRGLAPRPNTKGPLLFVATGRKAH